MQKIPVGTFFQFQDYNLSRQLNFFSVFVVPKRPSSKKGGVSHLGLTFATHAVGQCTSDFVSLRIG